MTSAIDPTVPAGPVSDVRDQRANWAAAKAEIEELQAGLIAALLALEARLPLEVPTMAGGILRGPLVVPALALGTVADAVVLAPVGNALGLSVLGAQVWQFDRGRTVCRTPLDLSGEVLSGIGSPAVATDALNLGTARTLFAPAHVVRLIEDLRLEVDSLSRQLRMTGGPGAQGMPVQVAAP